VKVWIEPKLTSEDNRKVAEMELNLNKGSVEISEIYDDNFDEVFNEVSLVSTLV